MGKETGPDMSEHQDLHPEKEMTGTIINKFLREQRAKLQEIKEHLDEQYGKGKVPENVFNGMRDKYYPIDKKFYINKAKEAGLSDEEAIEAAGHMQEGVEELMNELLRNEE